jgi:ATP/maltotriose-dependent transcriptional regulator MalT
MLGRFEEGRAQLDRARALNRELGLNEIGNTAFTSAFLEIFADDEEAARRSVLAGFEWLDSPGEKNRLSTLAGFLARLNAALGDSDNARRLIVIAEQSADSTDVDTYSEAASARSILARQAGDVEEALRQARVAVDLQQERGGWGRAWQMTKLAETYEANGDTLEAAEWYRQAIEILDAKELIPLANRARARLSSLD